MSDSGPRPQPKPVLKRSDGPPKPPTKTTLDLMNDGESPPENHPITEMVMAVTNATMTYSELQVLNGGGRYEKRERLELSLDRNLILLARLLPKLQGEDLQIVRSTLTNIRNYRKRFPRTDASNQEQADQARKILDEIPEV